jgi:hypothetical protein
MSGGVNVADVATVVTWDSSALLVTSGSPSEDSPDGGNVQTGALIDQVHGEGLSEKEGL